MSYEALQIKYYHDKERLRKTNTFSFLSLARKNELPIVARALHKVKIWDKILRLMRDFFFFFEFLAIYLLQC